MNHYNFNLHCNKVVDSNGNIRQKSLFVICQVVNKKPSQPCGQQLSVRQNWKLMQRPAYKSASDWELFIL